ncbi:hypothetical protein FS935_12075 [Metabacillus litoralis]|uniref:RsgI N-terminal anti-sigma domain-containing protein n=1 Tax=Metabacillus litoralis TaxID=152268 RepID=A0A5C6W442_9BACI|nr:hypothetical protein [Metabacillus litoralis]TXC90643.1 hypothetical protein FS935_12075 [Metabacillus litoralis]
MKHTAYKGIVVKITELHLVILQDNGRYKNVPKNAIKQVPLLGQSITYVEKASSLRWVPYISVAALIILSFISFSIFQTVKPSYLLVIDINPSLEMEVSDKGEVIDLIALNEDGEKIVSSVKDSNRNVLSMIDLIVKEAKKKGYLAKNPMITTSLISLAEDDLTLPVKEINDALTSYVQGEHVQVEVKEAALVEYKEAKKLNLSVNYYKQYQDLVEKELVEDLNDIKGKTIVELKSMASQPNKESQLIPNDTDQHKNTEKKVAKSKGFIKEPKKEQVPNDQTKGNEDQNSSEKSRNQIQKEAESKEKASTKIDNSGDKQKSINEQENKEVKKEQPIDKPQKEDPKPVERRDEEKDKIKQAPIVKESEETEENKNQRSEKDQENPSIDEKNEKTKSSERE